MNVRAQALIAIRKVMEEGAYLGDTLHMIFTQDFTRQEKAFVTNLVTGTVKRAPELDARINCYAKTKVKRMHPVVRNILRMSVYQIRYMDSVPDAAAVDEAVKLAKKNGQVKAAGFVNGILRNIIRGEKTFVWDEKIPEKPEEIAVCYSLPEWIVSLFLARWTTEKVIGIAKDFLDPPPMTIRVNTSKIRAEELESRLVKEGAVVSEIWSGNGDENEKKDVEGSVGGAGDEAVMHPCALRIEGVGSPETLPSFREGLFFVQDVSSMQVAWAAKIRPGEKVIDVCAAPGGKALHAADMGGKVLARDVSKYKTDRIEENITRCGFSNIVTQVWDALVPDPAQKEKNDVVIADLPCSGLGVLKRKPEIKYRLTSEDITALATLQQKILGVVCDYVKPGGRLVFSTCTVTKEENEENTKAFLAAHPGFVLEKEMLLSPSAIRDGFYIAIMRRTAGISATE